VDGKRSTVCDTIDDQAHKGFSSSGKVTPIIMVTLDNFLKIAVTVFGLTNSIFIDKKRFVGKRLTIKNDKTIT